MSEHQEYLISKLSESEDLTLTETLFKALVEALQRQFGLKPVEARKTVIVTLRALYAQ
jgi:hypothetical protein